MTTNPENQVSSKRSDVTDQLRKLAEISKEIEQHARQLAVAFNITQASELKRRIEELKERQDRLVMAIVDRHPEAKVREDFRVLAKRIEDFEPKIRACQDKEKLKELKKDIDEAVEEWVVKFQTIVSFLVGVAPPNSADSDDSATEAEESEDAEDLEGSAPANS